MISELNNKDLFYKENDTFIKYFLRRIRWFLNFIKRYL